MACVSHTCNCYAAAVAAIASRSFENLCKRILGAVAALAVANDNDDDIERKYIKFVRNVYSLWSRSLGKMLIFRSRSFSSLDCVLFGGVLCVCAFVCAKRDVNPFRIFFLLLSFPFICVFSQSPSLSFFAMLCAVGRCSFDIFVRIIIIQNANEGYFCRNVFRCLLRPLARAASLLIRCSFVQTSDMLLCILMRIRGTWRVCALSAYYVFCFCVCECDAPTVTAKWKYVLRNGFGLVQMRVLVILGVEIRHTFKQKLFIYVLLFFSAVAIGMPLPCRLHHASSGTLLPQSCTSHIVVVSKIDAKNVPLDEANAFISSRNVCVVATTDSDAVTDSSASQQSKQNCYRKQTTDADATT